MGWIDRIMDSRSFKNEVKKAEREVVAPVIRVIGVGGAGVKMAGGIYESNIPGIEMVVCDTDSSELEKSPVPTKLLIGSDITHGQNTGGDVKLGRQCAEESEDAIAGLFGDSPDIVVIVAGMGKGTGTGASPVIARIAKECGKLTLGFLTVPFLFEGQFKIMQALDGVEETSEFVDSMIRINNDFLISENESINIFETIGPVVEIWVNILRNLLDLVSSNSGISMMDLKYALRNSGTFFVATGYGKGERCFEEAIIEIKKTFEKYGRPYDVFISNRLIVKITCSKNSDVASANNIAEKLSYFTIKFGANCDIKIDFENDPEMDDIKISFLCSGPGLIAYSESDIEDIRQELDMILRDECPEDYQ